MISRFLVKLFDPMPFLDKITRGKTRNTYDADEVIFEQGSPADTVFYIIDGVAKEIIKSDHGKTAIVRMLEPGAFFGTSALDDAEARTTSVTAMIHCTVIEVGRFAMRDALIAVPTFSRLFNSYLLHYSLRLEMEKVELLFNSVQVRLAKKLLMLAHVAEGEPRLIKPEVNQEMLADMIGTSRSRVNFFLNRFRRLHLIEYSAAGVVVLPSLLKAILEDSPIFHSED